MSGPTGAAVKLGIPGSTLDSKIRSLKIDKNRFNLHILRQIAIEYLRYESPESPVTRPRNLGICVITKISIFNNLVWQ